MMAGYACRWCGGPCGRLATYCSDKHRVYANRVDRDYRRGVLRACGWYGSTWTTPRLIEVAGDGVTTWHVVRMRATAGGA